MTPEKAKTILGWLAGAEHQHADSEGNVTKRVLLPQALLDMLEDHLIDITVTTYTVVSYWPERRDKYSRLDSNEYDSAESATTASIAAQVEGAETVWIFKGDDVSEKIANWKEVHDRIEAGKKKKAAEERARRNREIAEANAQQKATVEKYEREQLKKLKEKYPDA